MSDIGVYVHIPFCARKCLYCDFVSSRGSEEDMAVYADALVSEIKGSAERLREDVVKTVYMGGGTPSFMDERHIVRIMDALRGSLNCDISEATIECNPESATDEKLSAYKEAGINRISLGVQSLSDNVLAAIGRIHDAATAVDAVRRAARLFDNVSCDLMIGLPMQFHGDLEHALRVLCEENVRHLSVYGLTVEKNTPIARMLEEDMFSLNEDLTADMYAFAVSFLKERGYARYEISNFAQKGYECLHNLNYWRRVPYVGFGCAAYGFYGGSRYNNFPDRATYVERLQNGESPVENVSPVSGKDAETETIMLSLRTEYGLDVNSFNKAFDRDFLKEKAEALDRYKDLLSLSDGVLKIREPYFYISNMILADLI